MRKTTTTRYDVAEHLRTPKEVATYLEACLEEANGDAAFIAKALGDVARAQSARTMAREAKLSHEAQRAVDYAQYLLKGLNDHDPARRKRVV